MKKILILTLGKGTAVNSLTSDVVNLTDDVNVIVEKLQSGDYSYRPAEYQYESEKETIESPFVGTVLIDKYDPDKLAIVGTGSSMWAEMYHKLCLLPDKNELSSDQITTMSEILDYERKYNKAIEDGALEKEEKFLNEKFSELAKSFQIQIILTKYGVNKDELIYNYEKFKQLMNGLFEDKENTSYKVAFDITHSFRSLPIFNLAVLKYIQSFTDSELIIEKVFYGNLDISRENDGKAPIIDLSMLTKIIDLANGIVEFKNTGNAVTICKNILEISPDSKFMKYVQGFDWATQTNNRKEVFVNLQNILEYSFSETEKEKHPEVYDAEIAIQKALKTVFGDLSSLDLAEQQMMLAKWSFRQGRVGLAAAIAKEALRSFLMKIYSLLENRELDMENENERKRVEQIFRNRCQQIGAPVAFKEYLQIEGQAVLIRNIFAHNLQENNECDNYDYNKAKEYIGKYLECIEQLTKVEDKDFEYLTDQEKATPGKRNYLVITDKTGEAAAIFAKKAIPARRTAENGYALWVTVNANLNIVGKASIRREKIIKKAKILCGKITEHFEAGNINKVVWDAELDADLILNASLLCKNLMDSNIAFLKMKEDGRQKSLTLPYWKIDAGAVEMADISNNVEYKKVSFMEVI